MKFCEFLELKDNCRQEGQKWLRFSRNVLCELNSGLRLTGHGCHGWSLVLWRKSSRFLPDLNDSCVKWDGEIIVLFCNGEVICRELVAVVKWYPGTALEGSYLKGHLHLWLLCMAYMQNYWLFYMAYPTWVPLSGNPGLRDREKEALDSKGNFANDGIVGDQVYH